MKKSIHIPKFEYILVFFIFAIRKYFFKKLFDKTNFPLG